MYIPDGLMDPTVWVAGWIIALAFVAMALSRVNKVIDERNLPYMAILAAGIFVAQMLDFPVAGGTTGHLIGAALATVLLGPWAAIVVILVVLLIQGFVFGDGGITALGLNTLNMAIVASLTTYGVMRLTPMKYDYIGISVGAWGSVLMASTACAIQLAVSNSLDPSFGIIGSVALPAMMGTHIVIGIGESIITVGILAFLAKVAPETLKLRQRMKEKPITEAST